MSRSTCARVAAVLFGVPNLTVSCLPACPPAAGHTQARQQEEGDGQGPLDALCRACLSTLRHRHPLSAGLPCACRAGSSNRRVRVGVLPASARRSCGLLCCRTRMCGGTAVTVGARSVVPDARGCSCAAVLPCVSSSLGSSLSLVFAGVQSPCATDRVRRARVAVLSSRSPCAWPYSGCV